MQSLDHRLREAIDREEGESRYLDLCLALRRAKTKETLLWAGDVWDCLTKSFCRPCDSPHIIDLEESQVEFVRWFAEWLRDFREGKSRDVSLVLNGGDRRGGKTFSTVMCQIACLLEIPPSANNRTIGWVISETFKKRDELEETIARWIPKKWYRHWRAPEFRYEFANGSILRNLSAQDPEDMRQGRVDILAYNEPQQMQAQAIVNGLFGTADRSGLTILAANPPTQAKGEWLLDLKEAIDNRDAEGAISFNFSSKLNTKVDQPARKRVGALARIINPKQVTADDEGIWQRLGDRAYPRWHKTMLQPVPDIGDITEEVIAKVFGRHGFKYLGGADFQGYPYNAAVLWKIFPGESGWIYWAVDEFMVEGAEVHLLNEIREHGYSEQDIFFVGDASGQWQNYRHEHGLRSFAEFKRDGWMIRPPREPRPDSKSEHVGNPAVESRLRVMLRLMEQKRYLVDPAKCPELAVSVRECPLKKDGTRVKKYGRHAHLTDAADYPLYRVDPKPKTITQPPKRNAGWSIANLKQGRGLY